jgi:hypothetical protein
VTVRGAINLLCCTWLALCAATEGITAEMFHPVNLVCKRPLLPINACAAIAGEDVRRMEQAIVSGELQFCFNIQLPSATKRCVRVHVASLQAYMDDKSARTEEPHELAALLNDLFPAFAQTISAASLGRVVCCDPSHAQALVRANLLECTRAASVNASALVTRSSAIEFLRKRRIL